MEKVKSNIAIVAISYFLSAGVELINSAPFYYFFFMIVHLAIMALCLKSKGKLIKGYGLINFIVMCLYFPYVFSYSSTVEFFMWEGWLNFANILLLFELIIIANGAINGLLAVLDRWDIDVDGRWLDCFFIDTWTT